MDRPIVYTQEQVRNYDHMENGWSSMVIGNSNLFADLTGASVTSIAGFAPTYNSNLTVTLAAGRIYALAPVDAAAYGGWPANTANIYQQGQNPIQTLTFSLAGLSSGQSRWALVEVAYAQADIIPSNDPTSGVLTYYNPANPSQPLVGPNNSGSPQPTLRQAQAVLTIKYGTAATTGSETCPTVDAGNVPMYLVHLTFGQSTITSANLFIAGPAVTPNPPTYVAPFIAGLMFLNNASTLYTATGTANAQAITTTFGLTAVPVGSIFRFLPVAVNTGPATLTIDGLSGINIFAGGAALIGNELQLTVPATVQYDGTNLDLLNPYSVSELTIFTANGNFTPKTSGQYIITAMGGGGGGGAGQRLGATTGNAGAGFGGSGGVLSYSIVSLVAGTPYAVVIGSAGAAGVAGNPPTPGGTGGNTTFNGVTVATGGAGGQINGLILTNTIPGGDVGSGGGNGGGNGGGIGGVALTATGPGNSGTSAANNTGAGGGGGGGAFATTATANNGGSGGAGGSGFLRIRRA